MLRSELIGLKPTNSQMTYAVISTSGPRGEGGGEGGEGNAPAGNEGGSGTGNPGGGTTEDPPAEDKLDEKTQAYIKQLREEAKKSRLEKKQMEDRLKKLEDANLTEAQRIEKEREELKARNTELEREARLGRATAAAARKGAKYPDVLATMIPSDAEDLDAAVEALRPKYPDLFGTAAPRGSANGGSGNGNGKPPEMSPNDRANAWIRSRAGRTVTNID